jgi:hypothetical protein
MTEQTVRAIREGFVAPAAAEPEPPLPPPQQHDAPPQAPLPSQLKATTPEPEPPLPEVDAVRRDIAANAEAWPIVVQLLYKPIKNNQGEMINALSFREPKASEINRIGNPTRMLWDNEIIIEERKMTYIMASLSGVLPPLLDEMDPRDWNSCALRLRKFFIPDLRAW